jgi:predicted porin
MNVGVSRQSNTVQYSALKDGTAVQISYSPGSEAQGANANVDAKLWAITLQQQWRTVTVGYDWTKMSGNSPASNAACGTAAGLPSLCGQPSSTGHKLRAGWFYQPGGQISLLWVKSVQDNGGYSVIALGNPAVANLLGLVPDVTATSLSQTSWGVGWEHMFGNVQALAQWGKINNITGCAVSGKCDNTGATTWLLGARYIFSKRTAMYVNYTTIRNSANYNMDFVGGWMTSASTTLPAALGGTNIAPGLSPASVGADPRLFGVGIMHNF